MIWEEVVIYGWIAAAGGIAGLTRFLGSERIFKIRTIVAMTLLGMISSIAIIGFAYHDEITKIPFKCIAIAIIVGYSQLNLTVIAQYLVKKLTNE